MTNSFSALKKARTSSFDKLNSQLQSMNQAGGGGADDRMWKLDVDKAGNGYAVIRFLPAPQGEDMPFVRIWDHGFQGPGGWYIENSLTTLGQDDPVSEHNSQLWNSGIEANKEIVRKQKRRLNFYANIYVVKDSANPQNEGKVMLFKFGKKIFDMLNDAMNPQYEDESPINRIQIAFPVSLSLGVSALFIALLIGLPAGMVAALRKNTWWDYLPMGIAMVGICLPSFVLGPILIMVFATELRLLPALGWYSWTDLILPSLTLGLFYAAYVARLTRAGMLETLRQDYVRTARAKGASPGRVLLKHAIRGGLLPVVTYLGPAFAGLVSGSFIIESIFFIPGLGKFFVTAAFNRDYTVVLGTVLFYATLIIILNLLVDFLQAWLDPKAREQR